MNAALDDVGCEAWIRETALVCAAAVAELQVDAGAGFHTVARFDLRDAAALDCLATSAELIVLVDDSVALRIVASDPPHAVLSEHEPKVGWRQA